MRLKEFGFAAVLLLTVMWVSGCASPAGTVESTQALAATVQATEAAPATTEAPAGKQVADKVPCKQDAEGMQFFANEAYGFCVLVPQEFSIARPDDHEIAAFSGTPQGGTAPLAYIIVSDAGGKTAAEIAAPAIAEAKGLGLTVTQTDITLSGEPAVVVDGLPGQDVTRTIFVVHNGTEYAISFTPADPKLEAYPSVQKLYDAVIGSFAFMR